jgi:hypothetical protein
MSQVPWRAMREEIDLPARTAIWVLTAHVLTILSPLVVVWVLVQHGDDVARRVSQPWALYAGACVLVSASVAESAQNTLDKWYLLGTPPSLLDCVFSTLVVLSLVLNVVGVWGLGWAVPAVVATIAFLALYLTGGPTHVVQALVGLTSAWALFRAFGDPVVFLSLVTVFLTLFFLHILVRTRQQAMHGFVTLVNAVGLMTTAAAIAGAATGSPWSWGAVLVVAAVTVGGALAARGRLLALPPTPHRAAVDVTV